MKTIARDEAIRLKAFYNCPELKEHYLGRIAYHIHADHLVRGTGWQSNGTTKGCAVGCSMEKYDHAAYEVEWQVPEWLARVEDTLFEGMSLEKSTTWPYVFADAINVGSNLENIKGPFLVVVLKSALTSFDNEKFQDVTKTINRCIDLWTNGGSESDFTEAAWAAGAAAWAAGAAGAAGAAEAAGAAGDAEAARAAEATARAAGAAAWAARAAEAAEAAKAAGAAAWAAGADRVARAAKYDYFADELIKLIKECKS